jgi:hypothetical protein
MIIQKREGTIKNLNYSYRMDEEETLMPPQY